MMHWFRGSWIENYLLLYYIVNGAVGFYVHDILCLEFYHRFSDTFN